VPWHLAGVTQRSANGESLSYRESRNPRVLRLPWSGCLEFGHAIRHAEISSEFLNSRHARGDGHFLCCRRESIVQAPGGAGPELIDKRLEVETRRFGQQTDRQNARSEHIVEHRFRVYVGEQACL
jgi:hypothetical protein